ncbi:Cytochrome c oxidase subunit 7A [Komagataella phaffii CBS 7435]|uniref:Cytochrome c oxidase subunit 9, mitochondrial n=4 Tax=Komagataella TaxID=460517 RepID=C4R2C4_KOMPG|nr:Hypothetical protein PAS_chr2-2_0265 [Komagataella phaffii GS115]CAH2447800.1 Cytochrome c oxidase subunit 7A [Komagataella phaffii CBS 7435]CAY69648.1 Hypothetical protein PAS_chr2-2_0265 [Komagataella phaffii GS115]SCV11997.1 Cytochrome c oxidase subunit 7A [Komagataella phaffii CBS 7435]
MAAASLTRIQGSVKRRILTDISVGLTLGFGFASYWWWGVHKPTVAHRENYYIELAKKKKAEEA